MTGKDISALSTCGHEAEVLFDKAAEFHVSSKRWGDAEGQWLIYLQEGRP